ncbi:MAG: xanthine dehydrogenase family protein subunit M [Phycisphaerae bacterium]|nr:xanthine dehydrogenase family protein subunit M [Phycisphaerae bacterium]
MHVPNIELHEATTLEQATALMMRHAPDARLLAGGTDLLVDLKTGRVRLNHVVSISRIDALRGISETSDCLRIGALTTVTELDRSPIVRERYSPILDATSRMAAPQVRNVATVGGNIASAVPCADLPPILTAMNASVMLWSPIGNREVPLEAFFTGPRQTVLRKDEVLTAILVPRPSPGFGAAYARFQLRDGNTIAVAAVAASLMLEARPKTSVAQASRLCSHRRDGGATGGSGRTLDNDNIVRDARIVLGAVSPTPKLVPAAGAVLVGGCLDEDAIDRAATVAMKAAEPISDVRGSAEFRREIVGVMTRRAIETVRRRAAGSGKEAKS